jgi:hypothetical protein
MKLRINSNSIRMRLSQGEVEELVESRVVYELLNFGNTNLTYQLILSDVKVASAAYENDCISISIPKFEGNKWASSDQVSIEETISLEKGDVLSILIEKDFKCLTTRPNEDESDLFENPLSNHDS